VLTSSARIVAWLARGTQIIGVIEKFYVAFVVLNMVCNRGLVAAVMLAQRRYQQLTNIQVAIQNKKPRAFPLRRLIQLTIWLLGTVLIGFGAYLRAGVLLAVLRTIRFR